MGGAALQRCGSASGVRAWGGRAAVCCLTLIKARLRNRLDGRVWQRPLPWRELGHPSRAAQS
eukprot:6129580-Alexandrium_andersonii.AAC.1